VFQNRLLLCSTLRALRREGQRALVPRRLPPSDGSNSLGQAMVAAARAAGGGARS
jgi:hydrogenase maturation factor HypF (carbamoyltransferase family)